MVFLAAPPLQRGAATVSLLLLLVSCCSCVSWVELPGAPLCHLLREPSSGQLYVGGVDWLHQLSPQLGLLAQARTGPALDSPDCLPPISPLDCPSARPTHNHNKLLLLEPGGQMEGAALIVCGSLFQGVCERRSLANLSHALYTTSNPVDSQYVAANDPRVSTVAVVVTTSSSRQEGGVDGGELRLLLVGRGHTGRGPGDVPPVTARRLWPATPPRLAFAQEEELGKLVVGGHAQYHTHFLLAVSHGPYVYFLLRRRDIWGRAGYRSYVARLCAVDRSFYSYVEQPISCGGGAAMAQGAWLGSHGGAPTLFVAMETGQGGGASALCLYGLAEMDAAMRRAQEACYSHAGRGPDGQEVAYIEYAVSSRCLRLPQVSLAQYPCGGEHTPSPIASVVPLDATPTITMTTQLTAVTTTTEAGLTIALLGDNTGSLHKVLVHSNRSGDLYDNVTVERGSAINADLLLDETGQYVYALTHSKLFMVPVSSCDRQTSCEACLSVRDPYCGWCVLEGRCTRQQECRDHAQPNHWLWSFSPTNQCLTIVSLEPSNQSRGQQTEVTLTVLQLPALLGAESLACSFGSLPPQPAVVMGTSITCQSPPPELLPRWPRGSGHMTLRLSVMFANVTLCHGNMTFYDCQAVSSLNHTSPCLACVSSRWQCNWCPLDQLCTTSNRCGDHPIILNHRAQQQLSGPEFCPLVSQLDSAFVPVGVASSVRLQASNLHLLPGGGSYVCVMEFGGSQLVLNASLETTGNTHTFTCAPHKFQLSLTELQSSAAVFLQIGAVRLDTSPHLTLKLYDCSAGQSDCSQCRAVPEQYRCVWCPEGPAPRCVYNQSCSGPLADSCPAPHITAVTPVSGPLEGSVLLTISGSNLGVRYQDVVGGVTVAGVACATQSESYHISTRVVCELQPTNDEKVGPVTVTVGAATPGISKQMFVYQDPHLVSVQPGRGPLSGGTRLTIQGRHLLTGQPSDLSVYLGQLPCLLVEQVTDAQLVCQTSPSSSMGEQPIRVLFGRAERTAPSALFRYLADPLITEATPSQSFYTGGRVLRVMGSNLDVVQQPIIFVWVEPMAAQRVKRKRRLAQLTRQQLVFNSSMATVSERCSVLSPAHMTCLTPRVGPGMKALELYFQLDNVRMSYGSIKGQRFVYVQDPELFVLNRETPDVPYRFKPGGVIAVEGAGLTSAVTREEVWARLGDQQCEVRTLDSTHLYCEPPFLQPGSLTDSTLPSLTVKIGNLEVNLGLVQYDTDSLLPLLPLAGQVGLGAGAALVVLSVLVLILMYRRKSKQALRDYKKVLLQLETLEINVGDQCRKEFTDLMTEMLDLSSDVGGPGLPLLDYRSYAERVFFPGQQGAPLSQKLDLPESRRATVEQGLTQLNQLLNNRLFLIKFVHTLEAQQSFSQRDRGVVASLLTLVLHDRLEYFTEVLKALLQHLVQHYVTRNPKLMLRRTETVVEKMLTNWMSICLYSFLKEVAAEPVYMLYRAIKYQVDKGPVDAVTGKAKRTLNDSHLLREDIEYISMTLSVLVKDGVEVQSCPVKVLDTDTITQVKEKILDQIYRGSSFSQRPSALNLDLEWRAGQAGHLTLSDDDVTAVVDGRWKKVNTLQHYKVPDGATVALVPRSQRPRGQDVDQVFQTGEKSPMLNEDEEDVRLWHLVKSSEEPDKQKSIPEIYLTRLLSMKGTLQKFVDDVFISILSTKRPAPIAVRYFFDFLDDLAHKHGIDDPETVHIWKTNSLPLRFWVNILKNPQFVLDVQVTDSVDAVLSVIAQTFIDSCTTSEHKVGRDSPVNKLLYAREIPRYKHLVERYYSDIQAAASGSYQEMNSKLTELSGIFASEMNSLVALHELYKYINKYYDQLILSLEEDASGQKMQLAYRLQQIAALVENKVTDL